MRSSHLFVLLAVVSSVCPAGMARAQETPGLAGRWVLNRDLSQFPREIGFSADFVSAARPGSDAEGAGQAGRGGGLESLGARPKLPESEEDARRTAQLTSEVRTPPASLTIEDTGTSVTIRDDRGQPRTFRTDGRAASLQLDGVTAGVTSKREAGRLVVVYHVQEGRDLRYTYSRVADPPQLVVEVKFVEKRGGDTVTRVYQPAPAATPAATPVAAPPTTASGQVPTADAARAASGTSAATPQPPAAPATQQPDAELKGLTRLGVVVEDLGSQSTTCGLHQSAIETAVSQSLTAAGLKAVMNADEDTYVYVNVQTTSLSTGLCVSRFDVFVYSNTAATLSHTDKPLLVQVSLLHKGGLAGGPGAAHTDSVMRGIRQFVDQFAARIRDANKR